MHGYRLVLAALLMSAVAQGMIGAVVFFDKRAGAIEDKAIVLNDREFARGNINKIVHEFLGATKDRRLCRLTIATSENDVMSSLYKHTGNPTYATTLGEISAYKLPRRPLARLLVLEGHVSFAAVPALTADTGKPMPRNITLKVRKSTFELLDFKLSGADLDGRSPHYMVDIFLRIVPSLSIADSMEVTRELGNMSGAHRQMLVEIRPDAWFMEVFKFPALYPFQEDWTPPKEVSYRTRGQVTCGLDDDVQCSGTNFLP